MGLAGVFGDQAYQCKGCGHRMTEYAPHCPVCLNKHIARIQDDKTRGPGPSLSVDDNPRRGEETKPGVSVAFLAFALLFVAVAAFAILASPKPDSAQNNTAPQNRVADTRPEVPAPRAQRPVRRAQTAAQPARIRRVAATSQSAPAKRVPMRLWSVNESED